MKIFISWSGERSQALAEALRSWLPLVLHYAKPWFSTSDIKSGDRWGIEIAKELQDTNFGILCVTKDNLDAPWLLFEAGALAKSIEDGRVIPLLLDLEKSDVTGPLTQFQSEKTDIDGISKLVESLNKAAVTSVALDTLRNLFDALWPKLQQKIDEIPSSTAPQKRSRPQTEILEELVVGIRKVEMRVRDVVDEHPNNQMYRRRRMPPGMLIDITNKISKSPNDPIKILIISSFFREEIPWLYEIALETYRDIKKTDKVSASASIGRFKNSLLSLRHGSYLNFYGYGDKYVFEYVEELLLFVKYLEENLSKLRRIKRPIIDVNED